MKLLIWSNDLSIYKSKISRLVEQVDSEQVMWEEDLLSFRKTLLENRTEIEALLIAPISLEGLKQILELKPLFDGLRLLIALPDTEIESLNLALKLFPRYVAQSNDPPRHIELILMRMLNRVSSKTDTDIEGKVPRK